MRYSFQKKNKTPITLKCQWKIYHESLFLSKLLSKFHPKAALSSKIKHQKIINCVTWSPLAANESVQISGGKCEQWFIKIMRFLLVPQILSYLREKTTAFFSLHFLSVEMTSCLHETETYCFILVCYALVLVCTGVSL
jgi:hypothetical protein